MGDTATGGSPLSSREHKTCFVTVGATAPFDALIKAVLEPNFLQALRKANYTKLQIQHGYEAEDNLFSRLSRQAEISEFCKNSNLEVTGFSFDKDGLDTYMRGAKGDAPRGQGTAGAGQGVVMSHAG